MYTQYISIPFYLYFELILSVYTSGSYVVDFFSEGKHLKLFSGQRDFFATGPRSGFSNNESPWHFGELGP